MELGVHLDYSKAVMWYGRAANQGIAEAMYELGVMYNNGQGVTRSHDKAIEWFMKAKAVPT